MSKKITLLFFCFNMCLSGCAQVQDDIRIVDKVLQEEEKIYDNISREEAVRVKTELKIKKYYDKKK